MAQKDAAENDAKIKEAKARVEAEDKKAKAEADAKEIDTMVEPFLEAAAAVKHARSTIPPVSANVERLPGLFVYPPYNAAELDAMLAIVEARFTEGANLVRQRAASARAGAAVAAKPVPEPVKAAPPAPDVERRPLYIFDKDVRWQENGEWRTACAYSVVQVPAAIAALGIKHNLADDPGSLRSVNIRSVRGILNGPSVPLNECIDLETGKPSEGWKYKDENRSPNLHSMSDAYQEDQRASGSWVRDGREKTGTIAVSRPR
jgi:hypothetical protein